MKLKKFAWLGLVLLCATVNAQTKRFHWKTAVSGGFAYKYITHDPTNTRFYTLKNGLTVILSKNQKTPNIIYKMVIRAGSDSDPRSNTGLAHYLEHLLFKGTDKYGTLDYAQEGPLLAKITSLYEKYHQTEDPAVRQEIYQEIDRTSLEASKFAIANEYDKMMKAIGSSSSNAHTSYEETVYEEDLPSNAVDKFLAVQAERFRDPVFRLFHTELEAVYEEKNRTLDDDQNNLYHQLLESLFPTHNYGQQTTIGSVADLKNPSISKIYDYYHQYYVPNNMALIMSGDINFNQLINKISKLFAYMQPKPLTLYQPPAEKPLTAPKEVNVYGPASPEVFIGYRGFAQNSHQSLLLKLISALLSNGKAGLMDLNITKQQSMLRAVSSYEQMKDYGVLLLMGTPKNGQSLQEAKLLMLEQIELLKKGDFDKQLMQAIIANMKLTQMLSYENNEIRADAVMKAFIDNRGVDWDKTLSSTEDMARVTKAEVVSFARQFFRDNYVAAFKHTGKDKDILKVEKPAITAVAMNTDEVSAFAKAIISEPVKPIRPQFLNFKADLAFGHAGIAEVITKKNTENPFFQLSYRFETGKYRDKLWPYAAQYLAFLGTDRHTAEAISKAFYQIACNYSFTAGTDESVLTITGLQENFSKAVLLTEELLAGCKPDEKALEAMKARILKNRENAKLNKSAILSGLMNYAQYGPDNPFTYDLNNQQINSLMAESLVHAIHDLPNVKHTITYYGPLPLEAFCSTITRLHRVPDNFKTLPPLKVFRYTESAVNRVFFTNYDMVQAEVLWVRNAGSYNAKDNAVIGLFNNYFGGGMGSVVFQTIRESKALAYSTRAGFTTPNTLDKQTSVNAYLGTQADKLNEAITAMNELLTVLPESKKVFSLTKTNSLSAIETSRITKNGVINAYLADKKLGLDHDSREDKYLNLKQLAFKDILNFHKNNLAGKAYSYCIVGSAVNINQQDLARYGVVTNLNLEQVFGY